MTMTIPGTLTAVRTVQVTVERSATLGRWNVTFESEAVPGTLAIFAGALSLAGFDICSALVRKTATGMVYDTFDVARIDGGPMASDAGEALASIASAGLRGTRNIARELRAVRAGLPAPETAIAPRVEISTDSELTTGITVHAGDRPGLLHDIAATLSRHRMRTRSVTVLTYGGKAHDSFRVVGADGTPPKDSAHLELLRVDLERVLAG